MVNLAWGGLSNGRIPAHRLAPAVNFRPLPGEPVGPLANLLRDDAARQWAVMDSHYFATTGRHLTISEGYRSFEDQQNRRRIFERVGHPLAAVAGHSLHGWGLSCDAGLEGRAWMHRNGARFGWHPTGLSFRPVEEWHFDYLGGGDIFTPVTKHDKPPYHPEPIPKKRTPMRFIIILSALHGVTAPYLYDSEDGRRRRLTALELSIERSAGTPEVNSITSADFDAIPKKDGSA